MRHSSGMTSPGSVRRKLRALAVALVAFVLLGLVDGALGVAWPSMRDALDRGISELGLLLVFGSVGYLTASLGYGRLHRIMGTGVLLSSGSALLLLGISGVALAPSWVLLAVSTLVVGLGGGLVDTGMNAHAALAFDVGSINLLHACYGVGATLGPMVITVSLVASGAWRWGYAALAALQAISAAMVWTRRRRWAGAEPDRTGEIPPGRRRLQLWSQLTLFFIYAGVEVAAGQWAFTVLSESRGLSTAMAGLWVAMYWGGLTLGRFGFGLVGERMHATRILDISVAVAVAGLAVFWLDPLGLGFIGLPVAGLGLAAIFPTLVSLTPARIGSFHSTSSIGYQLAAATLGAASIPWLLGALAESRGLETIGAGIFASAVVLLALHLVTARGTRRRSQVGDPGRPV